MANPTVFNNAFLALSTATGAAASVALLGIKEITLSISRNELSDSVMGDTIEAFYPGVYSIPISAVVRQDFTTGVGSAAGNDLRLNTLLANNTAVRCKIRATAAAVSATNPSYIVSKVYVKALTPLTGAYGVALDNKVDLMVGSGATLTRSATT